MKELLYKYDTLKEMLDTHQFNESEIEFLTELLNEIAHKIVNQVMTDTDYLSE